MKKVIYIIALLFLCSCIVDGWEIRQAQRVCKDNGGIMKIVKHDKLIYCNNGTVHNIVRLAP